MANRVVVITGASKGIGAATAKAFAQAGYDVVINYLQDKRAAEQTASVVKQVGTNAHMFQADIYTESGIKQLFDYAQETYKEIDVFINNAGGPPEPDFGDYDRASIIASLDGGFISAVLCTQAASQLIKPGGCILYTSSIYGLNQGGSPNRALYSAGKAAMINFAQTMAQELAPRKIRCNIVAPGMTNTSHWQTRSEAYRKQRLNMSLQKEFVEPEEVANAFLFLAETPHATGTTLVLDAGWNKKFPEASFS
jgi:NAD(P)-dependent dehydrogenase (short-subunit alcohol dehydrogenase family)